MMVLALLMTSFDSILKLRSGLRSVPVAHRQALEGGTRRSSMETQCTRLAGRVGGPPSTIFVVSVSSEVAGSASRSVPLPLLRVAHTCASSMTNRFSSSEATMAGDTLMIASSSRLRLFLRYRCCRWLKTYRRWSIVSTSPTCVSRCRVVSSTHTSSSSLHVANISGECSHRGTRRALIPPSRCQTFPTMSFSAYSLSYTPGSHARSQQITPSKCSTWPICTTSNPSSASAQI
mmetsp:Transcript_2187/g.4903  ORF Transcript_2187/g.4903 Transcript_2187/m.4903 type:complete len:233 (+) Transcript_2187:288-986(+)